MLTIGLIGLGTMGRTHARHYQNVPGCRVTAAYDTNEERRSRFLTEYQVAMKGSDAEVIESVDAVDVCTPTPSHHELILQALSAGKSVICEKPMCRTVTQCREVVDKVRETGLTFMPAHVVRFFREFARAHRLIKDGAVGTPAAARIRRGGPFPRWSSGWFGNFEESGGVLLDLMIHDFDWLRWTFGDVQRVYAKGLLNSGIPQKDYALATLKFPSGLLAHVEGTWADPGGFRVTFEVSGDNGFFEFDTRKIASLVTNREGDQPVRESLFRPVEDPYRTELFEFVRAVREGKPPPITAEDGLKAVEISEAAMESVRTGLPVEVGGAQ